MEGRLRPLAAHRPDPMTRRMNDTTRDRFLTKRWNNILTIALGVPTLLVGVFALATDGISDRAAFFVLVVLAAFY